MTDLVHIFERLGLQQYTESFLNEGFDTWETVLCIIESDLEALNVKLGHRRKLQREIAHARGISIQQVIDGGSRTTSADDIQQLDSDTKSTTSHGEGKSSVSGHLKRKYRRHPKPDENAPERAPSAYVIFSNKIREELRPLKLSFTEIAKSVGEKWQELGPGEKERYESQAAAAKEVYNAELAKYKCTSQYRDYVRYLGDFKARNAQNPSEGKRLKLETEVSNASSGSASSMTGLAKETSNPRCHRKDSISISGYSPSNSSLNSPTGSVPRFSSGIPAEGSQSSYPSTPVSASAKQPLPSQTAQVSRGIEPPRPQGLPRILPLEPRDAAIPHRVPHMPSEPGSSFSSNPRRSEAHSPASFLRHDTSKSSNSSNISGGSGASTAFTPLTPAEDVWPKRSLPPPANLLTKPLTGQPLLDLAKPSATSATMPKAMSEFCGTTLARPEYPKALRHLSIAGEGRRDESRPRSHSAHMDQPSDPGPHLQSISTHNPLHAPSHAHPFPLGQALGAQDRMSQLDSLSVLALAGRMMDRQQDDGKEAVDKR